MSYSVMPYALKLDEVLSVIGCQSEDAFQMMARSVSSQLADLDEFIEDNGDAGQISALSAMRDLYFRSDYDKSFSTAYVYGYVFKAICGALGTALDNDSWGAMRYDWFETVSTELKAAGVTFDTTDLIIGGVSGVPTSDFPQFGFLKLERISSLLTEFKAIPDGTLRDRETREAIWRIQDWFTQCVADGMDLVCFYH